MRKDNVLIYPYDAQFTPLLRNINFVDNYEEIHLSSLPGWGLNGKDASYADGGGFIGITVSQEFERILSEVDIVIFAEADNSYNFEKNIYPKILIAIEAGKNIITLIQVNEKIEEIKKKCERKGVSFTNYRENIFEDAGFLNSKHSKLNKEIVDCNTPILAIIGLAEQTNKFQLQLDLKSIIENMGYKVSMIGSRPYCEFLGFHSFPGFMKEMMNESEKILYYNKYIKNIELTEKPDLIIIAVPGGFMRYNNKITNDFGVTAYEIFQAIVPDAAVVSLYHEKYTTEYFEEIINCVKYKLGFNIDAFNVANRQIDWVEMISSSPGVVSTLTINPEFMNKSLEECSSLSPIPIFNVQEKDDTISIAKLIIDKLSEIEMEVNF